MNTKQPPKYILYESISAEKVRHLCISRRWCTRMNTAQYVEMLQSVRLIKSDISSSCLVLADTILKHSSVEGGIHIEAIATALIQNCVNRVFIDNEYSDLA